MRFLQSAKGEVQISCIGMGTIGAGDRSGATESSIIQRLATLEYGLDRGVNLIDCGEDYEGGFAEQVLGRLLEHHRNRIFLATKFSPANSSSKRLRKSLEGSLRRLKTDRIDLYQLHWPNAAVPLAETMETLRLLQNEGKIRFIGMGNCSFHMVRQAEHFLDGEQILTNQVKLNLVNNPIFTEPTYFDDCATHTLLTLAYGIMGQGNLQIPKQAKSFAEELCLERNITRSQLFIIWALSHANTGVLIRSMNYEHIDENLSVAEMMLSASDRDRLTTMFSSCRRLVPVNCIQVVSRDPDPSHPIYTSLKEALDNRYGICPSVEMLASQIADGEPFRPVELLEVGKMDGAPFYELIQGRMRYWAWIYLHGTEGVVPAVILGSTL